MPDSVGERNATRQTGDAPKRMIAFDGLRGVAILLVLLHHFTQDVPAVTGFDRTFLRFTNSTWLGVDLFFVLSGFLITGILFDAKGSTRYFRVFYARRILRILPVYYLLLVVLYLTLPLFGVRLHGYAADQPAWFWLHASNFSTAWLGWPDRPVAHLWSLAIEEHFYLLWPVVVCFLSLRALRGACLLIVVFSIGARWYLFEHGPSVASIFVLTFSRLDTLAIGGLLALSLRDAGGRKWLQRIYRPVGIAATAAVFVVLYGPAGLDWPSWSASEQAWAYTAIALACAAALAGLGARSGETLFQRAMSQAWLVKVGRLSYAMYLFHLPLESVARWLGWHPSNYAVAGEATWPMAWLYIAGNTAATIALAWLSWRFVEAPILAQKRRFEYRPAEHGSTPDVSARGR